MWVEEKVTGHQQVHRIAAQGTTPKSLGKQTGLSCSSVLALGLVDSRKCVYGQFRVFKYSDVFVMLRNGACRRILESVCIHARLVLTLSQPGGGHIVPPPPQVHFLKYLRNALSYGLETF